MSQALSQSHARALTFFTSAAVLVLEIIAGRLMAPYVGVSLETFTGIIGVILAGIALGSAIGGRVADDRDPRKLIGPALIIGGLLSWASLPIIGVIGPGVGSSLTAVIMLPLFAFFAPAAVLSAISPIVAKIRVNDLEETGAVVGGLSAAGTFGALFGTFITGFVLISSIPTRPIIIGLGAALIVAGAIYAGTAGGRSTPNVTEAGLGAVVFLAAVFAPNPCDFESAYSCGRVVVDEENPSLRFLILDTLRHGAVDLDDPTHLEFRYTSLIGDAIDGLRISPDGGEGSGEGDADGSGEGSATDPLDSLHIGGGGFSTPRYLEATRPGSTSLVLEIDGVLVEIAEEELDLQVSDDLQVRIGDARLATPDLETDGYDVIIGDAFAGLSVPWHLTTSEFVAELDRLLVDEGLYVMNVIDGGDSGFARASLRTLQEHFDHVGVIIPPDGVPDRPVNQILLASDSPIPDLTIDPEDGVLVDDVQSYIGDAEVLTDDFAPVEQLAANP